MNKAIKENRDAILHTIVATDKELASLKTQKGSLEEQISDHVGGFSESREVQDLEFRLKTARDKLNAKLSADQTFMSLIEQKAELNREIRDSSEILSSHVVTWKVLTGESEVEYGEKMGKPVILKGRLGKIKPYQPSIFSAANKLEQMGVTVTAVDPKTKKPAKKK